LSSSLRRKTTGHAGLQHLALPLRPTFVSGFLQVVHLSTFLSAFVSVISISSVIQANFEAIPQGLSRFPTNLLKVVRVTTSPSGPCAFSIVSDAFSCPGTNAGQMLYIPVSVCSFCLCRSTRSCKVVESRT
jgi:hypothetical protein